MEQFTTQLFEFVNNHWELALAFLATLAALAFTELRRGGKSVTTHEATRLINKEEAIVLDIRSPKEYSAGHIMNAINIPLGDIEKRQDELEKHKGKPVIVVCKLGQVSSSATRKLSTTGFANVVRLSGGITEWSNQNLPLMKN
jgi:rhodanese-related sulfurtransferase